MKRSTLPPTGILQIHLGSPLPARRQEMREQRRNKELHWGVAQSWESAGGIQLHAAPNRKQGGGWWRRFFSIPVVISPLLMQQPRAAALTRSSTSDTMLCTVPRGYWWAPTSAPAPWGLSHGHPLAVSTIPSPPCDGGWLYPPIAAHCGRSPIQSFAAPSHCPGQSGPYPT